MGGLTDGKGPRTVDFRNTVMVMTSKRGVSGDFLNCRNKDPELARKEAMEALRCVVPARSSSNRIDENRDFQSAR